MSSRRGVIALGLACAQGLGGKTVKLVVGFAPGHAISGKAHPRRRAAVKFLKAARLLVTRTGV